jgi:predicted lipid-binding transport protein (Tim44 family)
MAQYADRALVFIVTLVTLLAGGSIAALYSVAEAKRGDIQVELVKALANGALIGLIGLWVKKLFQEAATQQETRRQRVQRVQHVFEELKKGSAHALESLKAKNSGFVSVSAIFRSEGQFRDLLDDWQSLEPAGPAAQAREAYERLEKTFHDHGQDALKGSDTLDLIGEWLQYFRRRYLQTDASLPRSWAK